MVLSIYIIRTPNQVLGQADYPLKVIIGPAGSFLRPVWFPEAFNQFICNYLFIFPLQPSIKSEPTTGAMTSLLDLDSL